MGRKYAKNDPSLGRALINDLKKKNKNRRKSKDSSLLHTADLNDGHLAERASKTNLQSITEQSSIEEYISHAELAGTTFQAEKLNSTILTNNSYLISKDEVERILDLQNQFKDQIVIPRRPHWDKDTTAEELNANERKAFLDWRRHLAHLQERHNLQLTPYEKNLDFWRQLWRVLERSHIVMQIVDARNPLIFYCKDLEKYTLEINSSKKTLLLLNKADHLTHEQRVIWANYFDTQGIKAAFFSATQEDSVVSQVESLSLIDNQNPSTSAPESEESVLNNKCKDNINPENQTYKNNPKLLSGPELISLLKSLTPEKALTVGLVGYPNVGKSSTINALLKEKKVSVSSRPGKTKHFQTIILENDFTLCDCPGLVMPSFAISKPDMVICGILSIDEIKDHVPSVALVLSLIPKTVLQTQYGIMLPEPRENEDPLRPPTPEEFLNVLAYIKGFMTQNGQPDNARAARIFLKEFVDGLVLHVYAPPGVNQEGFHKHYARQEKKITKLDATACRALKSNIITSEQVDKAFIEKNISEVHVKSNSAISSSSNSLKPWKDHKSKRNKKEKLRRTYAYLDE